MWKWLFSLILLLALPLCACQPVPVTTVHPNLPTETRTQTTGQTQLPTKTQTQSPIPSPLPTETITPSPSILESPIETKAQEATHIATNDLKENPPRSRRVEIEAEDGLMLVGSFFAPEKNTSPAPGVVLLHMLWGERSSWEDFAIQLNEAGFAVLAMDFRGHGETGGEVDWEKAVQDVEQIWEFFREHENVDDVSMGIVGASIGANVAVAAAALEPDVKTVVLLSPGGNYAGVKMHDPMIDFGERPVLIVASEQDTYAAESAVRLEDLAAGEAELIMYPGSGHGTIMLGREPELPSVIIAWLKKHLR